MYIYFALFTSGVCDGDEKVEDENDAEQKNEATSMCRHVASAFTPQCQTAWLTDSQIWSPPSNSQSQLCTCVTRYVTWWFVEVSTVIKGNRLARAASNLFTPFSSLEEHTENAHLPQPLDKFGTLVEPHRTTTTLITTTLTIFFCSFYCQIRYFCRSL